MIKLEIRKYNKNDLYLDNEIIGKINREINYMDEIGSKERIVHFDDDFDTSIVVDEVVDYTGKWTREYIRERVEKIIQEAKERWI